jgi:hypothetical protein
MSFKRLERLHGPETAGGSSNCSVKGGPLMALRDAVGDAVGRTS